MEEINVFLTYSGISITLFLILLLSRGWRKQPSKIILAGILLDFLLVFLLLVSLEVGSEKGTQLIFPLVIGVPFSWGPLLYFYIRSVYEPDLAFDKRFFSHFLPSLVILSFVTCPLILHYSGVLPLPFSGLFFPLSGVITGLGMLLLGFYLYQSFKLLHKYRRLIKEHYSSLSKNDLRWVSVWVKGFSILLFLDIILPAMVLLIPEFEELIYLEFLFFTVFIWYIGYCGINQRPVFLPDYLLTAHTPVAVERGIRQNATATIPAPAESWERVSLFRNDSETDDLTARLHRILAEEKLYRDENLTLRQLAEAIGTSDKKLSELLNQSLGTNFYEYVNGYRVKAFKEMVINGRAKEYTLLALAFEAGFSSKASFNRIFKQHTGQTPSQFRNSTTD